MGQFIEDMQYRIKTSSSSIAISCLKIAVGAFLGLTLSLIGERIVQYGDFAFYFVIVATTLAFLKLAKAWRPVSVLVFVLVCVLLGLLLRMYIVLAPGA